MPQAFAASIQKLSTNYFLLFSHWWFICELPKHRTSFPLHWMFIMHSPAQIPFTVTQLVFINCFNDENHWNKSFRLLYKKEWGRGYICYTQREIHYVVSDQRGHSGKFKMLSSWCIQGREIWWKWICPQKGAWISIWPHKDRFCPHHFVALWVI